MPALTLALIYTVSLSLIAIAFLAFLLPGRARESRFALSVALMLIAAVLAVTPLWLIASTPAAKAALAAHIRAHLAAQERQDRPRPDWHRRITWKPRWEVIRAEGTYDYDRQGSLYCAGIGAAPGHLTRNDLQPSCCRLV